MERGRSRKARSGCLGRIFGFVLFLIVAAVGVIAAVKYMPSRERADLDALYAAGGSDRVALYLNYERQEESGVYVDGQTYLPAAWVDANLNERFYWDANENKLLYTLPTDIVTVEIGSKDYSVSKEKKSEDYVILKTEGNTTYVALDFIQQYTNIDYEVYDIHTVAPSNTEDTTQKTNGRREVTLITCTDDSQQRVIVKCKEKR